MTTVFTGIQPSGRLTIGNLIGALLPARRLQETADCLFCVVDLHALTVAHEPAEVRERSREVATLMLAAGLDPDRAAIFCQSHVSAHAELAYLMECTAAVGELSRMIQYKEKSRTQKSVRTSLLTYPALMAADILVYQVDEVPVGDDQRQHVELARDLAIRFNRAYGDTFTVPRGVHPEVAARLKDLADPTAKMSKSAGHDAGVIRLLDPPELVRRKIMRAVTDDKGVVRYDPDEQPGVANLLGLLAVCTGGDPARLAERYDRYGPLKTDVADAVLAVLEPIQRRYHELAADPGAVDAVLADGARRAASRAAPTMTAARAAIGLLPAAAPDPVS